jgi:hypothetical protein
MNEKNYFQWNRLDEVLFFMLAAGFIIGLAVLTNLTTEAIAALAGQLITAVAHYIKAGIERNGNGNGTPPKVVIPTPNLRKPPSGDAQ